MPPTLYLVRHGQAKSNVKPHRANREVRDAPLTSQGKTQCIELQKNFKWSDKIQVVCSSPLRRAIQTTVLAFDHILTSPSDIPFILLPEAQENSSKPCDVGLKRERLESELSSFFEGDNVEFDLSKIDFSKVSEDWQSKKGQWATDHKSVKRRAADLRLWLYHRPEKHILLVSHAAFLAYFTEQLSSKHTVKDGKGFTNCQVRRFAFTAASGDKEAHVQEVVDDSEEVE